ncbi:MAG: hemerythrin domain-containing protein [Myxococcota bacterium]
MKPITEILSREHQVVLSRLAELERALDVYAEEVLCDTLRFFDEVVTLHRRKEEEILFPALSAHFPPDAGPIACMLDEHREEKRHLQGLSQALDVGDREKIIIHGRSIVDLLRQHIMKEDHVLFPMAERLLDEDQRHRVGAGFRAIGSCCTDVDRR